MSYKVGDVLRYIENGPHPYSRCSDERLSNGTVVTVTRAREDGSSINVKIGDYSLGWNFHPCEFSPVSLPFNFFE